MLTKSDIGLGHSVIPVLSNWVDGRTMVATKQNRFDMLEYVSEHCNSFEGIYGQRSLAPSSHLESCQFEPQLNQTNE